jgi:uncharacterized protein (TIGR03086 family)
MSAGGAADLDGATPVPPRLDPLLALDLAQTHAAAVIAGITGEQWSLATPCDEWTVRDIVNKMVASTLVFADFGRRQRPDPMYDLIHPVELIGDDPLGVFQAAAADCRSVWRAPGALDGTAPSTVGEFPARGVLNARIFDTTILTWDIATATGVAHGISESLAAYVLRVARALVPNVRALNAERYKDPHDPGPGAPYVEQMVAATGRDLGWTP